MIKAFLVATLAVLVGLSVAAGAADKKAAGPEELALGKAAPAFELPGTDGTMHAFKDVALEQLPSGQEQPSTLQRDADVRGRQLFAKCISIDRHVPSFHSNNSTNGNEGWSVLVALATKR